MQLEEYENMFPHVVVDGMIFHTPNRHCAWRVESLYTKEPDTIEWLKQMRPGEVLFDVGANIGIYSIFAAKRGVKVYAFEPEAQNFAILQKNIFVNKLDNCIAFPLSLAEGSKLDTLRLSGVMAGGSCHTFGADVDFHGEKREFALKQGSFSIPLYQAALYLEVPQHIKIDVDGFEHLVLDGAGDFDRYQSILCEMDSNREEHMEWKSRLEWMGFKTDPAQIAAARRTEGTFAGIGNIIFRK